MALVDLCVVNFNTADKLQRLCFELMKGASDYEPGFYNLLVADNGSTDESVDMLRTQPPQNISTIFYNENIGYAAACNQLAAVGTSPIIALLNSDVWFTSHHLMNILAAFDENPEIAILGPKQLDERGNITHAGMEGEETTAKPRAWRVKDPHDTQFKQLEEMVSVAGSAYFIRRSIWEALTNCPTYAKMTGSADGAFLPTPHYYEETFCSYHARAHGYKVFYDGRTTIGHSWHASHPLHSKYDKLFPVSRAIFRDACDRHGIPHD